MKEQPEKQSTLRRLAAPAVFLCMLLSLTLVYGRFIIQNDGISYYAFALSIVRDTDLDLRNQFDEFSEIRMITSRYTKQPASYYSGGFGLLYAPFVALMEGIEAQLPAMRSWRPYPQSTRFPAAHGIAILLGSVLYGFGSVWLGFRLLVARCNAPPWQALFVAFAVFIGTPLLCYALSIPSFTHASDTFLVTLAFCLAVSPKTWTLGKVRWRNVLLGLSLALSVFLRNNNIVILPILVLGLLFFERSSGWKNAFRTCLETFLGMLPVIALHAHFNYTQYGRIIATGYTVMGVTEEVVSQGMLNSYDIFFHPVVGVYVWSPVSLLASAGLLFGAIKRRREAVLALILAVVVIASICFTAIIWPGSSFGQRLLTHLYICWVVGVYELMIPARRPVMAVAALAALWCFFLFNLYFIVAASPVGRKALFHNQDEYTPANMIRVSYAEYRRASDSGETSGPLHFWYQALCARPYPTLQKIIWRAED